MLKSLLEVNVLRKNVESKHVGPDDKAQAGKGSQYPAYYQERCSCDETSHTPARNRRGEVIILLFLKPSILCTW